MEKTLQKEINKMILEGSSKQEIFDTLNVKFKDKMKVANKIQATITPKSKKEFKLLNNLLLTTLIVSAILGIITLNYSSIVIDAIFIYLVARWSIKNYSWIAARAIFSFLMLGMVVFYLDIPQMQDLIFLIVVCLLMVIAFFLGLYIENKLNPSLKPKIIEAKDEHGGTQKKYIFDFKE